MSTKKMTKNAITRDEVYRALGIDPPVTKAQIRAAIKAKGKTLPRETRQTVLDLWWEGKTVGEIREALDISVDEFHGVILLNIKKVTISTLNKVTV